MLLFVPDRIVESGVAISNVVTFNDSTVLGKVPRFYHREDGGRVGCPPALAANTDIIALTVGMQRTANVYVAGQIIRTMNGSSDTRLYVDGVESNRTIKYTDAATWQDVNLQWAGTVAAGNHTFSIRSPQADQYGCGPTFGSIDVLVFE